MLRRTPIVSMIWRCLLLALCATALAKEKPKITKHEFAHMAVNLFYFDDSEVVMVTDPKARTAHRSTNAGETWSELEGVAKGEVLEVLKHPHDNQVAVVIGTEKRHWISSDQGKSWRSFETTTSPSRHRPAISFHASDVDRMLYIGSQCEGFTCEEQVYYTTDGFKSDPKLLHKDAFYCLWAKTSEIFTTGDEVRDERQILCIVRGAFNPFMQSYRLISSVDFFKTHEEPAINKGRTVSGVVNLAAVKHYLVAVAKSEGTTELAMYVTNDATTWHRAQFGDHKLEEDAYTLLQSTNYSMQVDVLTTKPTTPMGVLLTSNSNGTFFTVNKAHTNRNEKGFADVESIQGIQGIMLVNVVDNWEELGRSLFGAKQISSRISFDDGRTWESLKVEGDTLHLHSVTDQRNPGPIFSSPAPGIVMGVGNTGQYLKDYYDGDTYVSDDAGLTWTHALKGPHLYEFGDQGAIIVAVEDAITNEIKWSLNHGKDWHSTELEDNVLPLTLTTVPDSTSLKFVMNSAKGQDREIDHEIYSLDFSELGVRTCEAGDFEDWYARVDSKGEPTCIMGHTQKFRRRKSKTKCLVNDDQFNEPVPVAESCKCTETDFECDYENGFSWVDGKCELTGVYPEPSGACEGGTDTFKGSSGYRLVPGNTCTKTGGKALDEPIERKCKDLEKPVASGKIRTELTQFEGERFMEYHYLERAESARGDDETVIMRTDRRQAWISYDHGKRWRSIDTGHDQVVAIYPHQYNQDRVYLVTPSKTVYYSQDRGQHVHSFEAPETPTQDRIQILAFHPKEPDWLIWTGAKDCNRGSCQSIAHVSTHNGDEWKVLLRSVRKCQFVYREDRNDSDQLIFCEQYEDEDKSGTLSLLSSDDFFAHKTELKQHVINFATMAEYIVVATRDHEEKSLQVDTSIDGKVFADAQFPPNFQVPHQQAYTVLDSQTHAVFLHVTINNREAQEYGSIVKSNSNGTSYVLSIGEVNRNSPGFVDFEKMQGLEGVAIVNRVANVKETDQGQQKRIKTWITHNDGADWSLIPRPNDPQGFEPIGEDWCQKSERMEVCSLHLHGYTERRDPRHSFSSPSAVGLMIATGNVGDFLGFKKDANTFITRDGGLTWEFIAPGNWMWEYGDQGSIIVIVKEDKPTREILYSLDEGKVWEKYPFSDRDMDVEDITTVPSDTSRNFLLWGRIRGELVAINIDFSGLEERNTKCHLDEQHPTGDDSDYNLWSPKHPLSDGNCLFGHIAQYHRKKPERSCYNGASIQHLHAIQRNCTCTREDFECDFNYERQSDGSCALAPGFEPPRPEAMCDRKGVKEYWATTGYRRIPLTTCEGGKEMDYTPATKPCPGFEKDYQDRHGLSGAGLFFAVLLPIAAAAAVGYWVWRNWDGKFGHIRLGDGPSALSTGAGYSAFDRDAPWIKLPVMVISGVVAVTAAIPMFVGSFWNLLSSRFSRNRTRDWAARPYTSRSSFTRGRGNYAGVRDDDEGQLLGDDSEDEI